MGSPHNIATVDRHYGGGMETSVDRQTDALQQERTSQQFPNHARSRPRSPDGLEQRGVGNDYETNKGGRAQRLSILTIQRMTVLRFKVLSYITCYKCRYRRRQLSLTGLYL